MFLKFPQALALLAALTSCQIWRVVGVSNAHPAEHDMVVIAYNSYDARSETLVFASVDENEDPNADFTTLNAGMGQHLWTIDEEGQELKRGWMFRLRLTIQAVVDEYNRRGQEDFIAMVSDASDVYVSRSIKGKTIETLKQRFLNDFDSKIVFSTQIYCCNPWELHSFGRNDWDHHYEKVGEPSSIYKHLNAGLYMGYASAIIEMANEMQLWDKDYHRHEGFHSLVGTEAEAFLHMKDMEVDDDEWQISAWFFEDQTKETPLSTLDSDQHLFAVTGTFRAQQREEGYVVFSKDHFSKMFGPFPSSFSYELDMEKLEVCPYLYNPEQMEWTNKITGAHPLIFHFAGNDWLCACPVFAAEGFQGITGKFRYSCMNEFDKWSDRVQDAIQFVAHDENHATGRFVYRDGLEPLFSPGSRRLRPYQRFLDDGPYQRRLDDDPYQRRLDDDPYQRRLDDGPYRRLFRA
eukprot:scaffold3822_cov181-Amphora_coffeaeformis.AAC.5